MYHNFAWTRSLYKADSVLLNQSFRSLPERFSTKGTKGKKLSFPKPENDLDFSLISYIGEDTFSPSEKNSELSWFARFQAFFKPASLEGILRKLIFTGDEATFQEIAEKARLFPEGVLLRCLDFGTRFSIFEESNEPLPLEIPREVLELPGAYIPRLKVCHYNKLSLKKRRLLRLPLLLLSHAFDHALGEDDFASSRSLVLELYMECKKGKGGRQFLTSYGSAGPMQYFAESMTSYFSPEDKMYGKSMLKLLDKAMFLFLEVLFKRYLHCL